jgi:hypothetical protein
MRRKFKHIAFIILLLSPLAAWAFVKPVRVLAPELAGVTCLSAHICVDDASRFVEATRLYDEGVSFVQSQVGTMQSPPRAVFCSTAECSRTFGLTQAMAYNVGTFGVVIGDRGWRSYLVRHELIHHLQNERLGSLNAVLLKPVWFREGMAYSLSEDPRRPLPPRLDGYRADFESWFKQMDRQRLWIEAARL